MKSRYTKQFINYLFEQLEQQTEKPKLVFLIGPPAVGKTSYIKQNLSGYAIVNRDDLVEEIARESGVGTYDDMFARPPAELVNMSGPPPEKEIIQMYGEDEEATKIVDEYLEKIERIASTVPPSDKYGNIKPFDLESLKQVIVKFGVPTKFINPFVWEKISEANEIVGQKLADARNKAVMSNKNIAIDMVNMGVGERNSHRKDILKALNVDSNDLSKLNDYYEQIAIVFAPEGGYTPEIIDKIKKIATVRQKEIAAAGGSKTIPPQAYDRMFGNFQPPTEAEGFSKIEYVGVPSLAKLDQSLAESRMFSKSTKQFVNYLLETTEQQTENPDQTRKRIAQNLKEKIGRIEDIVERLTRTYDELYKEDDITGRKEEIGLEISGLNDKIERLQNEIGNVASIPADKPTKGQRERAGEKSYSRSARLKESTVDWVRLQQLAGIIKD